LLAERAVAIHFGTVEKAESQSAVANAVNGGGAVHADAYTWSELSQPQLFG
jgi:hypothetical protein